MANQLNTIDGIGRSFAEEQISAIREFLKKDGRVYISGVPDDFDHLAEVARLGECAAQYKQQVIREVKPDPKMEAAAISANNMNALSPHTESFEFDGRPPRYVALWCVQPAMGPGGETTLADAHEFLKEFTEVDLSVMRSRIYEWRSPASLKLQGIAMSARHPILEHTPEALLMRYSSREMYEIGEADDDLYERYVQGGIRFFDATRIQVSIERNAMLIWDNWRIIHSRNSFTDPRRHLRRILLNSRPGLAL